MPIKWSPSEGDHLIEIVVPICLFDAPRMAACAGSSRSAWGSRRTAIGMVSLTALSFGQVTGNVRDLGSVGLHSAGEPSLSTLVMPSAFAGATSRSSPRANQETARHGRLLPSGHASRANGSPAVARITKPRSNTPTAG